MSRARRVPRQREANSTAKETFLLQLRLGLHGLGLLIMVSLVGWMWVNPILVLGGLVLVMMGVVPGVVGFKWIRGEYDATHEVSEYWLLIFMGFLLAVGVAMLAGSGVLVLVEAFG